MTIVFVQAPNTIAYNDQHTNDVCTNAAHNN